MTRTLFAVTLAFSVAGCGIQTATTATPSQTATSTAALTRPPAPDCGPCGRAIWSSGDGIWDCASAPLGTACPGGICDLGGTCCGADPRTSATNCGYCGNACGAPYMHAPLCMQATCQYAEPLRVSPYASISCDGIDSDGSAFSGHTRSGGGQAWCDYQDDYGHWVAYKFTVTDPNSDYYHWSIDGTGIADGMIQGLAPGIGQNNGGSYDPWDLDPAEFNDN